MYKLVIKFLIFLFLSIGLTAVFNHKIRSLPPLGPFLNPFTGFIQNAESSNLEDLQVDLTGLIDSVTILVDSNGISHIFAKNDHDLYFAQGYITAKDRLWQMDFQTRYASGRLAEVVGEQAFELDRYQRRMGMTYGAEAMLKESLKDSLSKLIIEAYSEGVNAYIRKLSPKQYPLEFKLLDYEPELWTPLNSALLLKLMSATLARGSNEMMMSNILEMYGKNVIDDLFPNYPFKEDPIVPPGTRWDILNLKAESPDNYTSVNAEPNPLNPNEQVARNKSKLTANLLTSDKPENIGSNNWAVSGEKSDTGFPILANDPHLNLTLPSIWYQIQLQSPGINVSGVSIPGAPNIIVGYNQHIAWGVTNVGSDVLDWYKIDFKDETHKEYRYEDSWIKPTQRIETIKIRGKKSISDTVIYTVHGPVSYLKGTKPIGLQAAKNIPENYALKWVAHLPSNELRTFYELNRSANYDDYRKALEFYAAPAQNFAFADNKGDVAITVNGLFPMKNHSQGKFLLDGAKRAHEWQGRIPFVDNPWIKNPSRGFVSSANQFPTNPDYPYYLGWEFAPYERGHRINNRLESLDQITYNDMKRLQLDTYSILADNTLDTIITILSDHRFEDPFYLDAFNRLKQWNRYYTAESIGATIFETLWTNLEDTIWADWFKADSKLMRYPSRDRTVQLLINEPNSPWFSSGKDPKRNRKAIVIASFQKTIDSLLKKYGDITKWEWGLVKQTHVPHLANIGGLGSKKLYVGGAKHTVNAMSETNGPSWRMVVLLGTEPAAYGIIPGGSSGNPGSKFYDNQIATWENGDLNKLLFIENGEQRHPTIIQQIKLTSR